MVATIVTGGNYLLRGLVLLVQPGIRRYVVIPLGLNVALFGSLLWYIYTWLQTIFDWIDAFLPSWLHWVQWLVAPVLFISVTITLFFTFSMVVNLIAAPFNSLLAERVEYHLTGQTIADTSMTTAVMLTKTVPLMWNEIYKILYSLVWMIPFLLLFIVPLVHLAAPFFWLLYSAWMLAIQYMDIPMGNHDLSGRQIRQYLRRERLLSLGFGGMVLVLTSIPFVNFLAMPSAVAGATLFWVEQLSKDPEPL